MRIKTEHVVYILLILSSLCIAQFAYWLAWPYNVLTIKNTRVLTPIVTVDGVLKVEIDYCKNQRYADMQPEVKRMFINRMMHEMTPVSGELAAGCHVQIMSIQVPRIESGQYRLDSRRVYPVNPLRNITVGYRTEEFEVVAKSH